MTEYALRTVESRTAREFRDFVARISDERSLAELFEACLSPIVYSRHHWLRYKGEYRVRADLRAVLEDLRSRDPGTWDDEESDFAFALFTLHVANVGLDELKDAVSTATVRDVLEERAALYATVVEPAGEAASAGLVELAGQVSGARSVVELTHHLYSIIDGKVWYRTEGLIARGQVDHDTLTDVVEQVVGDQFGISPGPPAAERLEQATRACLAEHGHSAPLVRAIMGATLRDPLLRADHVTLTCPMGDLLDTPEAMTTSEAFFTETQLRDGLDLDVYQERLGHDSPEQLQRTIRARMLKLKRGAIRGLYGPSCIHGRFVEKHGGHMIYRNEDAHYRGHQSIGVSSGGRASFALRYQRDGENRQLTSMVGDYRVVRMSHDEGETFTGAELAHVLRYGEWIRNIVEETYRQGHVVRDDKAGQELVTPLSTQ
jgi:hypothetical protein